MALGNVKSTLRRSHANYFDNLCDQALGNSEVNTTLYHPHTNIVDNTTAFVKNADSIVQWAQPANTVIRSISILFPSAAYSTGAGNDSGFEVGTSSSGAQIVAQQTDQIIDAGADGTDIATGAFVVTTLGVPTEDGTTLAANPAYTSAARNVFLNTTCTNAANVVTPGTARWVIEYVQVA